MELRDVDNYDGLVRIASELEGLFEEEVTSENVRETAITLSGWINYIVLRKYSSALREYYFPLFEILVKKAGPDQVDNVKESQFLSDLWLRNVYNLRKYSAT